MRAVVYNRPRDVEVQQVPDAAIEAPTDVVVRITATNICGSDLYMYEGRTSLEPGTIIGHENLGEIVAIGPRCEACASVTGSACHSTSRAGSARTVNAA